MNVFLESEHKNLDMCVMDNIYDPRCYIQFNICKSSKFKKQTLSQTNTLVTREGGYNCKDNIILRALADDKNHTRKF